MRTLDWRWVVPPAVAVLVAWVCPLTWAQDARTEEAGALLKQGIKLYEARDYKQAQAALLKVNRDLLSQDQAKELDKYLSQVNGAIKRQAADLEAYQQAKQAYKDDDLEQARLLFEQVSKSPFVPEPVAKDATAELAVVTQKLKTARPPAPATRPALEPVATVPPVQPVQPVAVAPAPATQPVASDADQVRLEELQARIRKARDLIAKGDKALSDDQIDLAITCYQQAVKLAPELDEAILGLAKARSYVGQDTSASPLDRLARIREIERQETLVRFEQAIQKAREVIQSPRAGEDFDLAGESVNFAQTLLATKKGHFEDAEYRALRLEAEKLSEYVASMREAWQKRQVASQEREIQVRRMERDREIARQRADKIATYKARVRALRDEEKYDEAVKTIERILELAPDDAWAAEQQGMLTRFSWLMKDKDFHRTGLREEVKQMVDLQESQIPWYVLLKYPRNWEEIKAKRPLGGAQDQESEANRAVNRRLRQAIPKLDLTGIGFADAVQFLRDIGNVNIHVNWNALQAVGIDKNTPVNVKLTDVTFEKAMRTILEDVGGVNPLSFVVEDGVITISTKDDLARKTIVRVYDIRDLIIRVPNFQGPVIDIGQSTGNNTGGNNTGGSTSGGLFGNQTSGGGNNGGGGGTEENLVSRQEMIQNIIDLVTSTISRDTWVPNGGTVGSISELGGQLVVTQTSENHRSLLDLLGQLREARALQICIEARFITVSSSFLSNVGIDLNMFFNPGSDLAWQIPLPGQRFDVDPVTGARMTGPGPQLGQWWRRPGGNHLTPLPFQFGSGSWATPQATGRGMDIAGVGMTADALNLAATYLDGIQVDFLLRATQAHDSSRTLLAPRITIFNGQRAYIIIALERAYVSGLEPVVSENAVAFRPEISRVVTGSVLDVEGTISADRRYVTMTIRPSLSDFDRFVEYQGLTDAAGNPIEGSGTIQLPIVSTRRLECTVSVPDGGTLLLGGQKEAGEREREMGVPILSKVPVLNRAFTNRARTRDEQTLLVLVKPTIIIHKEYEDELSPPAD